MSGNVYHMLGETNIELLKAKEENERLWEALKAIIENTTDLGARECACVALEGEE